MRQGNRPTPADFALVHDFPVGSLVWQWWGSMHWIPAVVIGHMGPWVLTELVRHKYKDRSRTYPRYHLLRHRFEGEAPPPPYPRFPMLKPKITIDLVDPFPEGTTLSVKQACVLATDDGRLIRWYETESAATDAARDMAAHRTTPVFLLVPTRCFEAATPPVRETVVRRRKERAP